MSFNPSTHNSISSQEIERLAYALWEREGHPTGRDLEFHLEAETQLRAALKHDQLEGRSGVASPVPVPVRRTLGAKVAQQRQGIRAPRPLRRARPNRSDRDSGKSLRPIAQPNLPINPRG